MLVSAEVRWFWNDGVPPEVESWFRSGPCAPGGGSPRTDEYLLDAGQVELGLKKRGAKAGIEIKGLVALDGQAPAPFAGQVQIWTKWTSEKLTIDHLARISVHKTRWLRKYDTSGGAVAEVALGADEQPVGASGRRLERGCQFELVALRVDGDRGAWGSLAFESFGPLETVVQSLALTAGRLAAAAPPLGKRLELSYPAWLAHLHRA